MMQEQIAGWRMRITPGAFDAKYNTLWGSDIDAKGILRAAADNPIPLFLRLGDSWGNPSAVLPAGALCKVVLIDNVAGGTELRFRLNIKAFARNEQAWL